MSWRCASLRALPLRLFSRMLNTGVSLFDFLSLGLTLCRLDDACDSPGVPLIWQRASLVPLLLSPGATLSAACLWGGDGLARLRVAQATALRIRPALAEELESGTLTLAGKLAGSLGDQAVASARQASGGAGGAARRSSTSSAGAGRSSPADAASAALERASDAAATLAACARVFPPVSALLSSPEAAAAEGAARLLEAAPLAAKAAGAVGSGAAALSDDRAAADAAAAARRLREAAETAELAGLALAVAAVQGALLVVESARKDTGGAGRGSCGASGAGGASSRGGGGSSSLGGSAGSARGGSSSRAGGSSSSRAGGSSGGSSGGSCRAPGASSALSSSAPAPPSSAPLFLHPRVHALDLSAPTERLVSLLLAIGGAPALSGALASSGCWRALAPALARAREEGAVDLDPVQATYARQALGAGAGALFGAEEEEEEEEGATDGWERTRGDGDESWSRDRELGKGRASAAGGRRPPLSSAEAFPDLPSVPDRVAPADRARQLERAAAGVLEILPDAGEGFVAAVLDKLDYPQPPSGAAGGGASSGASLSDAPENAAAAAACLEAALDAVLSGAADGMVPPDVPRGAGIEAFEAHLAKALGPAPLARFAALPMSATTAGARTIAAMRHPERDGDAASDGAERGDGKRGDGSGDADDTPTGASSARPALQTSLPAPPSQPAWGVGSAAARAREKDAERCSDGEARRSDAERLSGGGSTSAPPRASAPSSSAVGQAAEQLRALAVTAAASALSASSASRISASAASSSRASAAAAPRRASRASLVAKRFLDSRDATYQQRLLEIAKQSQWESDEELDEEEEAEEEDPEYLERPSARGGLQDARYDDEGEADAWGGQGTGDADVAAEEPDEMETDDRGGRPATLRKTHPGGAERPRGTGRGQGTGGRGRGTFAGRGSGDASALAARPLSGGQAARLASARAWVKDGRVYNYPAPGAVEVAAGSADAAAGEAKRRAEMIMGLGPGGNVPLRKEGTDGEGAGGRAEAGAGRGQGGRGSGGRGGGGRGRGGRGGDAGGRGPADGDGASRDRTLRDRKFRDAHKASFGNHHRKDRAAAKMARGGGLP